MRKIIPYTVAAPVDEDYQNQDSSNIMFSVDFRNFRRSPGREALHEISFFPEMIEENTVENENCSEGNETQ